VAGSGDVSFWQAARYVAELRKKSRLGHSFSLAPLLDSVFGVF
jgi:hypothetical protein